MFLILVMLSSWSGNRVLQHNSQLVDCHKAEALKVEDVERLKHVEIVALKPISLRTLRDYQGKL